MTSKTELDLDLLAETLSSGPDLDVRIKAARSLVKIGTDAALELLAGAMNDADETFRARLVKVVGRLDHPFARARSRLFRVLTRLISSRPWFSVSATRRSTFARVLSSLSKNVATQTRF
jgi:HEAT repeat protein